MSVLDERLADFDPEIAEDIDVACHQNILGYNNNRVPEFGQHFEATASNPNAGGAQPADPPPATMLLIDASPASAE